MMSVSNEVVAWLRGPTSNISDEHPMFAAYLREAQAWTDDAVSAENFSGLWRVLTGERFLEVARDAVNKQEKK